MLKKIKTSGLQISAYNPVTAKPLEIQNVLFKKYPFIHLPVKTFRLFQEKKETGIDGSGGLFELSGIQVRSENGNEFTIQL